VTHEVLIAGQILGACAYTGASYRLWRGVFDRAAMALLAAGVVFDVAMAVLGSTSDLGDNPDGMPWGHPLFWLAVVLATLGMVGYILDLALLAVRRWREWAGRFVQQSQLVIWPAWMAGVALFILNVYLGWF